jgi:hypothetical protein
MVWLNIEKIGLFSFCNEYLGCPDITNMNTQSHDFHCLFEYGNIP